MEINEKILFQAIKKLKKEELLDLLRNAFINTEDKERRYIFGDLYKEITKKDRTPDKLLKDIKIFHEESLAGAYYAPFMINSKNWSDVPEETDEWFDTISDYLDFTCVLAEQKDYDTAAKCFKLLFSLIEKLNDGEEIVFADELGDWMIHADKDYIENYIITFSKTASIDEYVQHIIPLLKSDSYSSFADKVYQKVKKHSSKEQFVVIEKEIKAQSIRIK